MKREDDAAKVYLDSQDPELLAEVAKKPRAFTTIYNKLCRRCTANVQKTPNQSFDKYCSYCQSMIKKVLE